MPTLFTSMFLRGDLMDLIGNMLILHRVARTPEHSSREIAAKAVFKVSTEEIISRGESPRLPRSRTLNATLGFHVTSTGW